MYEHLQPSQFVAAHTDSRNWSKCANMSTVKASWTQLAVQGALIETCQNLPGDKLACSCMDGSTCFIQICERDMTTGEWDLVSQVQAPQQVTHLAWSHPENGFLLAGGTTTGSVFVWEAPRPGSKASTDMDQDAGDMREWQLVGEMHCSKHAVRHVSFVPRQLGLSLIAAFKDGGVHVLEADRVLAPTSWALQSRFQAVAGLKGTEGVECTGLSMRPFSPGTAPMVAVALRGSVDIWQYVVAVMSWKRIASLPLSEHDASVSSVHWAPTMGRPCELVAASHGSTVDLFSLSGDTSALEVDLTASLEHSAPVWKVEFNMLGTCLAAATETNLVHLWKPDFGGKWLLVSSVAGSPDAADEEED